LKPNSLAQGIILQEPAFALYRKAYGAIDSLMFLTDQRIISSYRACLLPFIKPAVDYQFYNCFLNAQNNTDIPLKIRNKKFLLLLGVRLGSYIISNKFFVIIWLDTQQRSIRKVPWGITSTEAP